MTIRINSIVALKNGDEWSVTNYRVEDVEGRRVRVRNLHNYIIATEDVGQLVLRYQTDIFDQGDTVRVRKEYANSYNEADGANELTVVYQKSSRALTTVVRNNNGDEFSILNERLYLVRPAKSFKTGDRVVVDFDLVKKYDNDGFSDYWKDVGVMVLTEDSGSRKVKYTSHVVYEKDYLTNNVPTRWLKLYEEPAKRAVGQTVKAEDVEVGDTIRATYTHRGMKVSSEGVVNRVQQLFDKEQAFFTTGGARFPLPYVETVYTLLEEAPEPVDENLQRLLDAEVGDLAFGTYANEYWRKVGDDEWQKLAENFGGTRTAEQVFISFYQLKYGMLEIYKKVEDAN